jgi:uncharacterized membrane protein YvbJ
MPACPNCGSTVPEDAVYCGKCGSAINTQATGNRTFAMQSERSSLTSSSTSAQIKQELKGLEQRTYVVAILALAILALLLYILFAP